MEQEKPCILIYRSSQTGANELRALCSGIEEEMIPFELSERPDEGIQKMGFEASERSRLGVGIGINSSGAALSYEKLSPDKPLFILEDEKFNEDELQKLGTNAARLVKGIAFKE